MSKRYKTKTVIWPTNKTYFKNNNINKAKCWT